MKSRYDEKHEHYRIGRLPHHRGIRSFFEQHFAPERTALELGAGTGLGTAELAGYFRKVVAVEPVAAMLDYASGCVSSSNVTWLNSNVEGLDARRLDYDYLVCFQATHWLYDSEVYRTLYARAEKPVLDICSFLSFPADGQFFDALARQHTLPQADRGASYPFTVQATYSYERTISVNRAAHQLASRSWVDHTHFPQLRGQIAERYGDERILVGVETRIHHVHLADL